MTDFIEDHGGEPVVKEKRTVMKPLTAVGVPTKHDKHGLIDENMALRQNIIRDVLSQESNLSDPEMMKLALKAMSDQDKTVISMARIAVDEGNNKNMAELAAAVVKAASANVAPLINLDQSEVTTVNHAVGAAELPPLEKEFVLDEDKVGTAVLSEQDLV